MTIKLGNIRKTFQNKVVLKDISLEFNKNEITCIMGPSGCGKTTLLNIILGIVKSEEGTIEGISGLKIGAVFQEDRLLDDFSVLANISFVCNKKSNHEVIKENLQQVGLGEVINKKVGRLSGGMKRRVSIVRAMVSDSDIILMDEPFKGLDEKTRSEVIDYVKKKSRTKTMIISTHHIEEVEMLKGKLIIL